MGVGSRTPPRLGECSLRGEPVSAGMRRHMRRLRETLFLLRGITGDVYLVSEDSGYIAVSEDNAVLSYSRNGVRAIT